MAANEDMTWRERLDDSSRHLHRYECSYSKTVVVTLFAAV